MDPNKEKIMPERGNIPFKKGDVLGNGLRIDEIILEDEWTEVITSHPKEGDTLWIFEKGAPIFVL